MRSIDYGGISHDHGISGAADRALAGNGTASLAAARADIQRRYRQWQAPGARYAELARGGLRRAGRMARGGAED